MDAMKQGEPRLDWDVAYFSFYALLSIASIFYPELLGAVAVPIMSYIAIAFLFGSRKIYTIVFGVYLGGGFAWMFYRFLSSGLSEQAKEDIFSPLGIALMVASFLLLVLVPRPDEKGGKGRTLIEKISGRATAACGPGIICLISLVLIIFSSGIPQTQSAVTLEYVSLEFVALGLAVGLFALEKIDWVFWNVGAGKVGIARRETVENHGALAYFLMIFCIIWPLWFAMMLVHFLLELIWKFPMSHFDVAQQLGIVCTVLYLALAWTHMRRFPRWYFEEGSKELR